MKMKVGDIVAASETRGLIDAGEILEVCAISPTSSRGWIDVRRLKEGPDGSDSWAWKQHLCRPLTKLERELYDV